MFDLPITEKTFRGGRERILTIFNQGVNANAHAIGMQLHQACIITFPEVERKINIMLKSSEKVNILKGGWFS